MRCASVPGSLICVGTLVSSYLIGSDTLINRTVLANEDGSARPFCDHIVKNGCWSDSIGSLIVSRYFSDRVGVGVAILLPP
jgi:hypothetical protein